MRMQVQVMSRPSEHFDSRVTNVLAEDVLPTIAPELDGMAWQRPWTYNGGYGLSGFHWEDGWMHFGHHMFALAFHASNALDPKQSLMLDQQLLSTMYGLSRKTWVFSKQSGPEGILAVNKHLSELHSLDNVADSLLATKVFVLDPRHVDRSLFTVVHQLPGDYMYGDSGHSVTGLSFFSAALNHCVASSLQHYMRMEYQMSSAVRSAGGLRYLKVRERVSHYSSNVRTFVLSGILLGWWLVACLRSDLSGPHIPQLRDAVRSLWNLDKMIEGPKHVPLITSSDHIPTCDTDVQCELCGLGCISRRYVLDGRGVCVFCAAPTAPKAKRAKKRPKKVEVSGVLVLLSTYMARKMGLE